MLVFEILVPKLLQVHNTNFSIWKASPLCSDEMFHARYDYRIQICFFYPCTKSGGYLCGESWFPSTEEVFQLLKDVCHCEQKNLHIRQVNSGSFLIQVCSPAEQKIESRASHISHGRLQISSKSWNVQKDPPLRNRRHKNWKIASDSTLLRKRSWEESVAW